MLSQFVKKISRLPIDLMLAGFDAPAVVLQRLFVAISANPVVLRTLVYLEAVRHLRRSFRNQVNSDYPVLVINRDRDTGRLERFRRTCENHGIRFERLTAVDLAGSPGALEGLEPFIGPDYYGRDTFLRGAVGCFLSHARAWQTIVDRGHDVGLVCEDDGRFLGPLPSSWKRFPASENCDLIFLNQRMAVGLQQQDYLERLRAACLLAVPSDEATRALQRTVPFISGLGTDGYLVTRRGAEKLLEILRKNLITMEVDWFLFFYSMTPSGRAEFIRQEGSGRFDGLRFSDDQIVTHVLFPFWVEQATEDSTIGFANPQSYVSRAQLMQLLRA